MNNDIRMSGKSPHVSNYDFARHYLEADTHGEPQMPRALLQIAEAGIAAVLAVVDELKILNQEKS